MILTRGSTPSSSRILLGLMSRWISPWAWAAAKPAAICWPRRRTAETFEWSGLVEFLLQGLTRDVFHDEVGDRLLFDGIDGDNVFMSDFRGGAGLAQEAFPSRRGGSQLRRHHLDGDDAVERLVERLDDNAEAALTEQFQHFVVTQSAERAGLGGRLQEG